MWAFTGGCHYTQDCDRYLSSCGACPQLGSQKESDLSRWIWRRKAKTYKNLNLTIVTPSLWLGKCAKSSTLLKDFRVECIPNGIDTEIYRPMDKSLARDALRLPQDKKLILFGSLRATSDRRKGFHLLQGALQELRNSDDLRDSTELVVFGSSEPSDPPKFGFKTHYLGSFNDDLALSFVYSAADVFVLPSIQENLANTVMEALACGTPCVAFDIGGMPDMIEHQQNGYLAEPYQTDSLAKGISLLIRDSSPYNYLSIRAREKVEKEFSLETQANLYSLIFKTIKSSSRKSD